MDERNKLNTYRLYALVHYIARNMKLLFWALKRQKMHGKIRFILASLHESNQIYEWKVIPCGMAFPALPDKCPSLGKIFLSTKQVLNAGLLTLK